jgi:two-component system chemotaxis response regulator CheB
MGKRLIVMGASLGGLEATKTILSTISRSFNLPIALVLHRDENSPTELLINILSKDSPIEVIEAEDKMMIQNSKCYIAPAGYHLLVDEDHFALSTEIRCTIPAPRSTSCWNQPRMHTDPT